MNTNLYVELSTNDQRCQRVGCILPGLHVPAEQRLLKWKWSEITYSQVWWPILIIRALHLPIQVHTHSSEHTHTHREHTPGAVGSHLCCGAQGAVGGSVPCSRAPRRGIECGEIAVHLLPPPTIPAGPRLELATFRLWVRISTIRPQLPMPMIAFSFRPPWLFIEGQTPS